MAGNKTVPLTWGTGGHVIGTATIDENGLIMAEIDDVEVQQKLFGSERSYISVYTKTNEEP